MQVNSLVWCILNGEFLEILLLKGIQNDLTSRSIKTNQRHHTPLVRRRQSDIDILHYLQMHQAALLMFFGFSMMMMMMMMMMMIMIMMTMLPLFVLRIHQNSGDFHPSFLLPRKLLELEPQIFFEHYPPWLWGTQRDKTNYWRKLRKSSPATCYFCYLNTWNCLLEPEQKSMNKHFQFQFRKPWNLHREMTDASPARNANIETQ